MLQNGGLHGNLLRRCWRLTIGNDTPYVLVLGEVGGISRGHGSSRSRCLLLRFWLGNRSCASVDCRRGLGRFRL